MDKSHQAIFTGGIIGRQGKMTVAADTATANYTGGVFGGRAAPELTRIYARGHVTITRPSEKATGNFAVYDLKARKVIMIGDVTLQRPSGFVSGGRLSIDLDSNLAVLNSSPINVAPSNSSHIENSGRVTGTFTVPNNTVEGSDSALEDEKS